MGEQFLAMCAQRIAGLCQRLSCIQATPEHARLREVRYGHGACVKESMLVAQDDA